MKKILFILLLILCCTNTRAQIASEEAVKAAFLFHFINFTEWNDSSPTYNICIADDAALREAASDALNGKELNNRRINVVSHSSNCHILVAERVLAGNETLTIGRISKGAIMEFRRINNKLKFAINPEKFKNSKFKVSSQLLKLAIVDDKSAI